MDTKRLSGNPPTAVDALKPTRTEKTDKVAGDANASVAQNKSAENYGVNLSARAKNLMEARQKATEIARNTPDIREDRVAELKKRIQSGEYKVDAAKVADGIMQEAIKDELASRMHEEAKSR